MAKKLQKPDDLLEARSAVHQAVDANGHQQYQIDALPVIMGALSMETQAAAGGHERIDEEELNLDKSAEEL